MTTMGTEERLTLREARDRLGQLVDAAFYGGTSTVIMRHGQVRAAVVPDDVLTCAREAVRGWNDGEWRVGPTGDAAMEALSAALGTRRTD
jgi:antitoxin (DNA-binding transcriptional repressor) of toxin-antitoxin stability system